MNFRKINVVSVHVKFHNAKASNAFMFLGHVDSSHCSSLQRLNYYFTKARCANVIS